MRTVKIMFDLTCQSYLGIRVYQVERTSNGLDGIYGKKGCDRKNGMRWKGVRKRNAADGAPLAVTDGTMGSWCGWLSCRGRAESIKSNVWWRYNEMNLCRAVMLEYLTTLFWFCFWPSRHPSCYTVFELNSTTGRSLQERVGQTLPGFKTFSRNISKTVVKPVLARVKFSRLLKKSSRRRNSKEGNRLYFEIMFLYFKTNVF